MKDIADLAAGGTVIGAWTSILPEIAAGLAIIWTLIRIGEWVWARILKRAPLPKAAQPPIVD